MKMFLYGAVGIFLLLIVGCGSGAEAVKKHSHPPPRAEFNIAVTRAEGGDLNFRMSVEGKGADTSTSVVFVRNIRDMYTLLYHPERGLLDSLVYTMAASFAQNDGAETITLEARSYWTNALGVPFDSLYTETYITLRGGGIFVAERGFSLLPQTEDHHAVRALELKGWAEDITDSSALFVVLAERKRMIDGEYFPTSEQVRVIITDEHGTTVWNSAQSQVFLQIITPVEPKNNGEVRRYELYWNGRDQHDKPAPPGTYNVLLMLRARPSPYSVSIPLYWKVPHDK